VQILLAFIFGAAIGAAVHYLVGSRSTRGVALGPVLGAFAAGLAWMILTWAGVGIDSPWIWLSALLVPTIVTVPAIVILTRLRVAHDAHERERLKIG